MQPGQSWPSTVSAAVARVPDEAVVARAGNLDAVVAAPAMVTVVRFTPSPPSVSAPSPRY